MRFLILLLALSLSGCSLFKEPEVIIKYREKQLFHPALPARVDCGNLGTYTVEDAQAVQKYSDNIRLRSCMVKLLGNLEETQQVMCSYRKELEEPFCQRFELQENQQ